MLQRLTDRDIRTHRLGKSMDPDLRGLSQKLCQSSNVAKTQLDLPEMCGGQQIAAYGLSDQQMCEDFAYIAEAACQLRIADLPGQTARMHESIAPDNQLIKTLPGGGRKRQGVGGWQVPGMGGTQHQLCGACLRGYDIASG